MSVPSDAVINDQVSFKSKASNDNNNYRGKIVGMTTAEVAKSYTDIFTYNANVQASDANVPDTELLTFMLIKLLDPINGSTKFTIPFAQEWVLDGTFDIINTTNKLDITVYDAGTAETQTIIDLLRGGGFKAKISRVY